MFNFFVSPGFGQPQAMNPACMTGMPFMSQMPGLNPMLALSGMMQMMEGLLMMMGGELPGCGMMAGTGLMSAANPMFGGAGPQASIGMQDFLGCSGCCGNGGDFYPAPSRNWGFPLTPWMFAGPGSGAGHAGPPNIGPSGGGSRGGASSVSGASARSGRVSSPVAPSVVSDRIAPGTAGMLARAGSMEGMHGMRDRDQLKKITGRLDPAQHPWCAAFAMNMLEQHGVLDLDGLKNRNYTPTIERWARDKGIYGTPDKYTPKPGDAIMFDWQGQRGETDHIGIVEKVENGRVYTIEGNAGNKVRRRSYKIDDKRIDGYVVTNPK